VTSASVENLQKASLNEVDLIKKVINYKGVDINLLDMTTASPSNTFKDVMACVTFASAMEQGIKAFCCQSSGNTAMSFIKYANHTGMKMILFYPLKNAYKIDAVHISENITLIQLDATEAELKKTLAHFS
jgi:threonine synthase